MTEVHTDVVDRIAMLVGGGLVVLGVVVLGFVNAVAGRPHVVETGEAGEVLAEPIVPPELRAYAVALGLLVWAAYAIYTLRGRPEYEERTAATPAD